MSIKVICFLVPDLGAEHVTSEVAQAIIQYERIDWVNDVG